MAYIRFYNPDHSANRDENANEAYEQFVNHFSKGNNCDCFQGSGIASNISETDKEYRIEMALPGVSKKDISIKHDKGYLSVKVEPAEKENAESYTRHEFDYTGASRTFKTGDKIDADNVLAKYENGLLTLTLPKKEAYVNKPAQSIVVE